MRFATSSRLLFVCCALLMPHTNRATSAQTTAIVGGTIVDVTDRGRSTDDIEDGVVLIEGGVITRVGPRDEVAVPGDARVIDASGGYVVPGLIDGFATLNDQTYANAYLYEGVTSIIGVGGGRRGDIDLTTSPRPEVYPLDSVGYEAASTGALIADLEALHDRGVRVALLMYRIEPEQLRPVVERAHELGMVTIGELGASTYAQGEAAGIDAFVHITRYCLDMAPKALRDGIYQEPFSDDLASHKWRYYLWLAELGADDTALAELARRFGTGSAALMPTHSLLYLDQPFARNPWDERIASTIAPGLIDNPATRTTGRHLYAPERLDAYARVARATLAHDRAFHEAGAVHLAGSATDVWGTMPGISLHTELELLTRAGLTAREALAAATSNYAEVFGWSDVGRLAPGVRADVLVLDDDPREDVAHLRSIRAVLLAGNTVDREALLVPPTYTDAPDGTILSREPVAIPDGYLDDAGRPIEGFEHLADVTIERITYASDALRVKGYLVTPNTPGTHPCVIHNRGGNREFGAITFDKLARLHTRIASWGYVVVASQYRGVDGGDGMEQFGGEDVNDVLNLIPLLDGLPEADAQRLGMAGGSRGGMMTYLALTRTDRIDGAIIRCGLADTVAWGAERPEIVEVFNDLVPEYDPEDPTSLATRSGLHLAHRFDPSVPILITHGTADWRVPPRSSLRLAARLQELGRPYRLVMFEGADHGLSEVYDEFLDETHAWLDRFVRDGEPMPDTTPHGP